MKEIWLIEEGSEGGSEGGSKVVESDAEGSDIASGEGEIKVHDRSTSIYMVISSSGNFDFAIISERRTVSHFVSSI